MTRSPLKGLLMFGAAVLIGGCTDGIRVPTGTGNAPAVLALQPHFSAVSTRSAASADAVGAAFDRVDRFRMIVRRANDEIVSDTIIEVTPGQESYELRAEIPVQGAQEFFQVDLIALVGTTELFRSEGVRVQAVSGQVIEDTSLASAELDYVGPGATAASLELDRDEVVLGSGSDATLTAVVRDQGGGVVPDVPLGWSSTDAGVVSVADGVLSAVGDGTATVTASTPNALSTTALVYVLDGEIAFVRDGTVHTGSLLGSATAVGAGSQPAFAADGSILYYVNGGRVIVDGTTLTTGTWPAGSPDGTKIAYERAGNVWIVNVDGSTPTEGPEGRGPQWQPGGDGFVVRHGGLEQVSADGSTRSTIVGGDTGRPVLAGGMLAWVGGGVLRVAGTDGSGARDLAAGVSGRPALSPDGRWAIVTGADGLLVAATDGSAPPVLLPHGQASEPAWRGNGLSYAPAALVLTGLDPATPAVGDEVTIQGSGFDVLIPENNSVSFTTDGGDGVSGSDGARAVTPAPVLSVTASGLTTIVPEGIVPGPIEVSTLFTTGTFDFDPPPATVTVRVRTSSDQPVAGATVTLTEDEGDELSASTDADGAVEFAGLFPGTYSTSVDLPDGFVVLESPEPTTLGWGESDDLEVVTSARVVSLELASDPLLEVGEVVTVDVHALDALGNPVTDPMSVSWEVLTPTRARYLGGGLEGRFAGVIPSPGPGAGDVQLRVTVEDLVLDIDATVATAARGFVYDDADRGYPGVPITLSTPAGEIARQLTGPDGEYHFGGLFPGRYTVGIIPPPGLTPHPSEYVWDLGEVTRIGVGDFSANVPDGFELLPESSERLPGGTQQFTVGGVEGPFNWTVNGIAGGNATFGTITSEGFYTAPGSIPSPSSFQICASVVGNPGLIACSDVTISPIPTAGEDVIVINDLNFFSAVSSDVNNQLFIRNVVNYTAEGRRAQSGTVVQWDNGHANSCGGCASTSFPGVVTQIESQGYTIRSTSSEVGELAEIADDVKVLFLIMPTIAYTRDEINAFKRFASEGGRIVFMGEHSGFYPELAIENQFLADMGAEMTNIGALHSCGTHVFPASYVQPHQTTNGMTGYTMACASEVVPGPNDFVLFLADTDPGQAPIGGVAKIDTRPLPEPPPGGAPARIQSGRMKKTHDPLGNPIGN